MTLIYKILDNKTKEEYIGSTNHYSKRMSRHKKGSNCRSQIIIDRGDYQFIILEECLNSVREIREQHYMDLSSNLINKKRAYFTKEDKKNYDKRRYIWKYSWVNTKRDWNNLSNIDPSIFL